MSEGGLVMDERQIDAFWSKVGITDNPNECWEWRGARSSHGYGNVRVNKRYMHSHRVAFTLANGDIPDGLIVMHICDNQACCNPRHLVLGTTAANYTDMLIKNRQGFHKNRAIGERNHNAKLTADSVFQIRSIYAKGDHSQSSLAKRFGVAQAVISSIIRRKTWRHVA